MKAGDLDTRVVLQRATEARDSFGDPIATWTELSSVWANVDWTSGNEGKGGDREYPEIPVRLEVRRSTETMSLREKDRALVPLGATKLRVSLSSTTGTTMVVDTPGVFPPEGGFCVRADTELMLVSSGAGSTSSPYVVARGSYGTTAARHEAGRAVLHMVPLDIVSTAHVTRAVLAISAVRTEVQLP